MRGYLVLIVFFISFRAMGQEVSTTIRVVQSPEVYTPLYDSFHLAGDLNDWDPAHPDYQFDHSGEFPELILQGVAGQTFQYKLTCGYNWETVESQADGSFLNNRSAEFIDGVIEISIAGWEEFPAPQTATANTRVLSSNFYMPELERFRRVWVVLPNDYYQSESNYPVIYMHDAQNLFSQGNSFAGEWGVDESMESLENVCLQAIVVGIDNGGSFRIDEYSPWVNTEYGGGEGAAYAEFLVNTLKPFIDEEFRTATDPGNTAIIGSSLGALISLYAAKSHPDVFGKVGLFSPALWFNPEIFDLVASAPVNEDQLFYLIAGSNESESMLPLMQQMSELLIETGHPAERVFYTDHSDGAHSEWYWGREFPNAMEWLFCNDELVSVPPSITESSMLKLYPIPSKDSLQIELSSVIRSVTVLDLQGKILYSKNDIQLNKYIIHHQWPAGLYSIQVIDQAGKIHRANIKCE